MGGSRVETDWARGFSILICPLLRTSRRELSASRLFPLEDASRGTARVSNNHQEARANGLYPETEAYFRCHYYQNCTACGRKFPIPRFFCIFLKVSSDRSASDHKVHEPSKCMRACTRRGPKIPEFRIPNSLTWGGRGVHRSQQLQRLRELASWRQRRRHFNIYVV